MTKESISSRLKEALKNFPDLIYAYIGGSFNTPFNTEHSDIDLMLAWRNSPSVQTRSEVLIRLKILLQQNEAWTFLDSEGITMRDAIKIHGIPKIEIYHYGFATIEYILENQQLHEGLSYSIFNRVPLISSPELELFIDSYKPSSHFQKQDLIFEILSNYQSESISEKTYDNIIRLFSLNTYDSVPSRKHWEKILINIPNHELLRNGSIKDWISQSLAFLESLGKIKPDSQLQDENNFVLRKQSPDTDLHVYKKVLEQKERLQEFLSWPRFIQTIEDQNNFSVKTELQWQKGQAFHFQIFNRSIFAGAISIHSINYQKRNFEFGYWIDQAAEGQGLVSKGIRMLLTEMTEKGWKTAKIRFSKNNIKSQRVAEKLGMTITTSSNDYVTYSISL
ncbi:GNAT family N-acetyltransferase [Bdellovibrio bacteriovorus]|uniref:GNAT family N-acetyltransferase n=1 Tax=Bdellovibrio TaxID=958 RepID=UPI0035A82500